MCRSRASTHTPGRSFAIYATGVDVGYTGGWLENPTYHDTHDSQSGHAEAVRITFDPSVLSYEDLLEEWFFRLHDPTTLNRRHFMRE